MSIASHPHMTQDMPQHMPHTNTPTVFDILLEMALGSGSSGTNTPRHTKEGTRHSGREATSQVALEKECLLSKESPPKSKPIGLVPGMGVAGAVTGGATMPAFIVLAIYLLQLTDMPLPNRKHVLRLIEDRFFTAGSEVSLSLSCVSLSIVRLDRACACRVRVSSFPLSLCLARICTLSLCRLLPLTLCLVVALYDAALDGVYDAALDGVYHAALDAVDAVYHAACPPNRIAQHSLLYVFLQCPKTGQGARGQDRGRGGVCGAWPCGGLARQLVASRLVAVCLVASCLVASRLVALCRVASRRVASPRPLPPPCLRLLISLVAWAPCGLDLS